MDNTWYDAHDELKKRNPNFRGKLSCRNHAGVYIYHHSTATHFSFLASTKLNISNLANTLLKFHK